jgi:aspartate aminotransferase-like enzyme
MIMANEPERIVIAPGPVHVPRALRDAVRPMHHRSDAFRAVVREVEEILRELLGTSSPVYTLTSSGTGAMEAAVANAVRVQDRVLVVSGGKFGDRWNEILSAYGCEAKLLSFEPGAAVDIDTVVSAAARFEADIIACTHVESSSGLLLDLHSLASRCPESLIMVDAIASLGAEELSMEEWGIDAVVSASQKAFAAPPGISFVVLSDRIRERSPDHAAYYFDLGRYEAGRDRGDAPFTPALETIQLVHASLVHAREMGWDRVRERHRAVSTAFIEAMANLSLESFPENPSSAVQAFALPDEYDGADFLEQLEVRHGIIAAGGQGELKGTIFRTGFLGQFDGGTLLRIVRAIASTLSESDINTKVTDAERALEEVTNLPGLF